MRQNETQTVEDFASEITKLAARAYGDMDRYQKNGLLRGLRSVIKRFAIMQQTVPKIMK